MRGRDACDRVPVPRPAHWESAVIAVTTGAWDPKHPLDSQAPVVTVKTSEHRGGGCHPSTLVVALFSTLRYC